MTVGWGARSVGARLDPYLQEYLATLREVLSPLTSRSVLDISAGSGWLRQLGFREYASLDLLPPHEHWDIDTPLPEHHRARHELAVCLGALHYALDPRATLRQFVSALQPQGELVLMTPWLYPPHDRPADRWRLSPQLVHDLLSEHFEHVDLWYVGSVWHVPLTAAKRVLVGPFRGVDASALERIPPARAVPRVRAAAAADLPLRWTRPMNTVAHAYGLRG